MKEKQNIPTHIGIIMDGNGRWAKKHGLPRSAGHKKGAETLEGVVKAAKKMGIKYVTLYAFSTENWKRPQDEVDGIMNLLRDYLKKVDRHKGENVRSLFIGDRTALDNDIVEKMNYLEENSKDNTELTLTIAINYGARDEIVAAVREIARKAKLDELNIDDIDTDIISNHLYTHSLPDPDLIIRPSGELRLSNFMLWQIAYSEFVFMDILWPDFTGKDLMHAVEIYSQRSRRFGGI